MPTDNIYLSQGRKYTIKRQASTDLPARMVSPPLCAWLMPFSKSPGSFCHLSPASLSSHGQEPGPGLKGVCGDDTWNTADLCIHQDFSHAICDTPGATSLSGKHCRTPDPSAFTAHGEPRSTVNHFGRHNDWGMEGRHSPRSQTITRAKQHVEAFSKCRVA